MRSFKKNKEAWEAHYTRERSKLTYPDENVVRYLRFFFDKNSEKKKINALDLGCGNGRHLNLFKEYPCWVIGQDFVLDTLRDQSFSMVCASANKLPYKNEIFDIVLSWGVIHYMPFNEGRETACEIYRVLKENGRALVSIRSDMDTHLEHVMHSGDLESGDSVFYSKTQAYHLFSMFKDIRGGFMYRQPINQNKIIAHHILEVCK